MDCQLKWLRLYAVTIIDRYVSISTMAGQSSESQYFTLMLCYIFYRSFFRSVLSKFRSYSGLSLKHMGFDRKAEDNYRNILSLVNDLLKYFQEQCFERVPMQQ